MKIRLILGDQLNHKHSWLNEVNSDHLYVLMEMKQETSYVKHHIQKLVGFFSAMRNFKNFLEEKGHKVYYLKINNPKNKQSLTDNLHEISKKYSATSFEYQLPDEYRLDEQLKQYASSLIIPTKAFDTEHFYTTRSELKDFFSGKTQIIMESFYREMRKKHNILLDSSNKPEGGKWNYDKSNRKKYKGKPGVPIPLNLDQDLSNILEELKEVKVSYFGNINAKHYSWPTSRIQALKVLSYFLDYLMDYFGDYQDAMHTDYAFLFHSRLSFALNTKMLSPKEVVNAIIKRYKENPNMELLTQTEGFVRQIIGWREFMRGIYWKEMPGYELLNYFKHQKELPAFYWSGETKMNCLKQSIQNSLDNAYAHHIQRLMITGNLALLLEVDPSFVDEWYLGVYIDAIEWVEITNTRGMSQFADGGIIATKPYISSGSYIHKMSNYCEVCTYNVKEKVGEKACPFNSLYWNFLEKKREKLQNNQRMRMMYSVLDKMDDELKEKMISRAEQIVNNPGLF